MLAIKNLTGKNAHLTASLDSTHLKHDPRMLAIKNLTGKMLILLQVWIQLI